MEHPFVKLNKTIAVILFLATIGLSLLSQLPRVLDAGLDVILKLIWILPFGYMILTSPQQFLNNKLQPFYIFVFTMVLFCFTCQMATGNKYFGPDINNFAISLLVTVVSYIFWQQYGSTTILKAICVVLLIGGTLLALQVYVDYLRDADITERSYAYGAKNSVGQILLCCATAILMFYKTKNKYISTISRVLAVIMLIVMVETKSRATLVSALYIAYYFTFKYINTKAKITIIALSFLTITYIFLNENAYNVIIESIVFGGRDASDANSLSSNRLIYFAIALQLIPRHLWIGAGDYYVDCMPLNILTEFGIFGLTVVLLFLTLIMRQLWKQRKTDKLHTFTYVLFISFLLNSLFEAQPPFGPGMKCFILWMFYGFTLASSKKNESLLTDTIATTEK